MASSACGGHVVVTDVSAEGNIGRPCPNVIMALTCANAISRHPTDPADTGLKRLLICGFGVQVPGGAPCLCKAPPDVRHIGSG